MHLKLGYYLFTPFNNSIEFNCSIRLVSVISSTTRFFSIYHLLSSWYILSSVFNSIGVKYGLYGVAGLPFF